MKNKIISKGLVFGIIVIFFGAGIISTASNINERVKQNDYRSNVNFNQEYLLITDSTSDTVGKYDPYDGTYLGDLINGVGLFSTPVNAIKGPDGNFYVSDQVEDSVFVFDQTGSYLYTYADASDGLNNIRGIDFRGNHLFVTSGDDYVAEFSGPHTRLPNFIQDGSDPFDILFLPDGRSLLADIQGTTDNIRLYDTDGTLLQILFQISFPEQVQTDSVSPGAFLTAGFSANIIQDFELTGTITQTTPYSSGRGVYRLGNGNLLATSSAGVQEIQPGTGAIIQTKKTGSCHFIESSEAVTNQPPNEPSNPDPADDAIDVPLNAVLSWTGGDPDPDDTVTYDVYFGTATPPPQIASNESATTYNPGIMNPTTKYYWKIVAWDSFGASTSGPIWEFTTIMNNPPNTPDIDGPEKGKGGTSIDYSFSAIDPDNDDVNFYIEWGDGSIEDWIGPYDSGEIVIVSHIWTEKGTYVIKVKAKDVYDAESDWAELEISIPRNKGFFTIQPDFTWLFERFPNILPILKQLIGL